MHIGLFRQYKIAKIELIAIKGVYEVYDDTVLVVTFQEGEKVQLNSTSGSIQLIKNGVSLRVAKSFKMLPLMQYSEMELNPVQPVLKKRRYNDGFEIIAGSNLTVVNVVDMNNYLAGVIESEGGGGRHTEYYKVQALMSRTYAL